MARRAGEVRHLLAGLQQQARGHSRSSLGQPYALGVVTGGQPASDIHPATAVEAGRDRFERRALT